MTRFEETALEQIIAIEERYDLFLSIHDPSDFGSNHYVVDDKFYAYIISAVLTAIDRIAGSDSIYMHQAKYFLENYPA